MNMKDEKTVTDIPEEVADLPNYRYNRELFYHFDPEKGFSKAVNYQNDSNQVIIRQSWDAAEQRLEEVRRRVIDGNASPIAYYMEKVLMEVPMLAAYTGFARWRVRRHLTWKVFRKLNDHKLEKYAKVFEITVEELRNPNFLTAKTE